MKLILGGFNSAIIDAIIAIEDRERAPQANAQTSGSCIPLSCSWWQFAGRGGYDYDPL